MNRMHRMLATGAVLLTGALAVWPVAQASEPRVVTVAHGLVNPWALAFLPDGRMLVTERPGRMRIIGKDGRPGPALDGLPAVAAAGQCGLLDVALDPKFSDNRRIWFTYAEPGEGGNSTVLASAKLGPNALSEVRVVFRQMPKVNSTLHCGSRIVFDRQGRVLVGLGERGSRKEDAQTLDNHLGKVVRIELDGKVPADNPFLGTTGALPEIFSRGHRNIQGAALHPATGELWAVEHGPQGGDELNVVEPGRNYGWPLITYGRNYGIGTRIGEEGPKPGFEQPVRWWVPTSVAPSGMAFVTGERYPGWKGSLLIGTLREQTLIRLTLNGRQVLSEERLLRTLSSRIRDVREGPDGYIYLLTEGNEGRVLRLEP